MLQPTRSKYRKAHKGRIHGKATRVATLNYGTYGLKAMQPDRVIGKQIEAARVALTRHMERSGKVWSRIFPNIPVSKKPTEVRMGKGKGSPEFWACRVKPEEYYLKLMVFQRKSQGKLYTKPQLNFQLKLNLLRDNYEKKRNKITHKRSVSKRNKQIKKDLFNMRFKKVNGQLQNISEYSKTRRNIARMYSKIGNKK